MTDKNTKTFTKDKLYDILKYIVFCEEFELDSIKNCSSFDKYQRFLRDENIKFHFGDCTKEPCSCMRCKLSEIEIKAQNILDLIWNKKDVGHCGKICLEECEGIKND